MGGKLDTEQSPKFNQLHLTKRVTSSNFLSDPIKYHQQQQLSNSVQPSVYCTHLSSTTVPPCPCHSTVAADTHTATNSHAHFYSTSSAMSETTQSSRT